jgi:hypothetical protein
MNNENRMPTPIHLGRAAGNPEATLRPAVTPAVLRELN